LRLLERGPPLLRRRALPAIPLTLAGDTSQLGTPPSRARSDQSPRRSRARAPRSRRQ
jgi:hypothetical protein